MMTQAETKELIADLLEEETLLIGGLLAVHEVEDEFIWTLFRNLDVVRGKFIRRIEARRPFESELSQGQEDSLKPHPAIEEFLLKLRRGS
jgi:hypothetical protein